MVELGELERHHEDFAKRQIRVVAVSTDEPTASQATQSDFPHLVIVSDAGQGMAKAMQVVHPGAGMHGEDVNAPTTFLLDGNGYVVWFRRPRRYMTRLAPAEILEAADGIWPR
jgi:peroxiredoxin